MFINLEGIFIFKIKENNLIDLFEIQTIALFDSVAFHHFSYRQH